MSCFPIFKVESYPLSAARTIDHGIQIPGVVQYSQSTVQLSLTVDSDLVVNEQYSATIIAVNANGQKGHNVTVEFGMWYRNLHASYAKKFFHYQIHTMYSL